MGWNRAKIAVWGRKQEAARHCRVAPSHRFVNMAICTKKEGNICVNRRIFILLSGTYYASPICFK